jgi:phosphotransferase system HPr (HPr) family protein
MIEKEVTVKSDAGVHARPAMMLVREAMKYPCDVRIIKGNMNADGKSIMSVLGLAIVSGTRLLIQAEGEGEADIVDLLVSMIENDFKTGV